MFTNEQMQENMNKIHHQDCLTFMKQVPDNYFDLVLTDPPYGIDVGSMGMGKGKKNTEYDAFSWDKEVPSDEIFEEIFRISKNQIIWGGNYFNLPPTGSLIAWDKIQYFSGADFEIAWTNLNKPSKSYRMSRAEAYCNMNKKHPTQKPINLIEFCLNYADIEKHHKIFDPFMGSGTTAVACKSLGLDWCGCELEEDYCNIARKRLEKVQCSLF